MRKVYPNLDIELLSISEYRKKYKVYALFEYINGSTYRRFADIVRKNHEEDSIDAYLIMINPGSCHKKSDDNPVLSTQFYKGFDVVEAISDPAQKCVMALMDACELNKIRILNLFDLAEGNLDKALKNKCDEADSIFSEKRKKERLKYMPSDAICIAAWGMGNQLKCYKKQAYECLGAERIIGVDFNEKDYTCRYIKPRGKDAQMQVIEALAKKYCGIKVQELK